MKLHEREDLLKGLKVRFEKNMQRHKGTAWAHGVTLVGATAWYTATTAGIQAGGTAPRILGSV